MQSISTYLKNPRTFIESAWVRFGRLCPDKLYLKVLFRLKMGYKLNLKNPKTFSEKLQWLKLYDHNPNYTKMVDKYAMKEYVAGVIGDEYVIPTLGVWDRPEDIEWDNLPEKFVLKTTHDGGGCGVVICNNKSVFNKDRAINKLSQSLHYNTYKGGREWPYKNVPHRIIAEKYIDPAPGTNDLPDYKFFCFDGKVNCLFIATDRHTSGKDVKFDFYDADFNHLPFRQGHENAISTPQKPRNFEMMKQMAAKLSKGIPQVRIDFYEVGNLFFIGEITFFHFSGMMPFNPKEWDGVLGDMITLPEKRSYGNKR